MWLLLNVTTTLTSMWKERGLIFASLIQNSDIKQNHTPGNGQKCNKAEVLLFWDEKPWRLLQSHSHAQRRVEDYDVSCASTTVNIYKVESKDVEDLYLSLPNQHKHWRFPLVTSSEEWTMLGTNPLLTPSQPSWIFMSPLRTSSKMSLVRSTKA